ncbi:MAG TPA: glycoside hydrolase family 38 C-terminal domain-containing protein [Verrucomicrobiae bacterium]|nr:glycoside hydrolase family 38 C-terminal domain-containing protein [Verrucomicrobiae bacterium]
MSRIRTAVAVSFLIWLLSLGSAWAQTSDQPDLSKQPTLYVVGYAHLDTEWRWEYPQVIDEYIRRTMEDNFKLFEKYPHYVFNFTGANRYRFMKEYFPDDFAQVKKYVAEGRWFPAGSSMEEGDVNAPSAEAIIRQILYGNEWFRREFGKASAEYMLPDCFGFPASLPTILAHSGVKGFSTQKLVWGSSAPGGGPESLERTPEGTPFNVGVWVGPDGESVLAALNPGSYGSHISTDLSKPLASEPSNPALADLQNQIGELQKKLQEARHNGEQPSQKDFQDFFSLRSEQSALARSQQEDEFDRYQNDWADRVLQNGKISGVFTDYHYYGTGDIGGAPDEESVKRLEAIVTRGSVGLPPQGQFFFGGRQHQQWPPVSVGDGPVHVISSRADQMFLDISPSEAAGLPRYTGEMELTNHSAGSLTSQAYQKRWLRKDELLADDAEKASIMANWLGARPYPMQRLNDAWTLVMGGHFHDIAAGTATPKSYEFAWNDDVIAMNQFAGILTNATEAVAAALDTEAKGVPVVVFNPLNIARQDIVEANVKFPGGMPKDVHVVGPDGKSAPAQLSDGKVVFLAKVPSVGYAVYDVQPGNVAAESATGLRVSDNTLENRYYRVEVNADGDVASIFDKTTRRELLAAPARLAISYDNPQQWPAWNMDWDQEQAAPKAYVSGPAKIRVVESGPVQVAIEVTRETAGSRFVQTIRLSAGDAGKWVEFGNVIDWDTRESNLKATFPLTASNEMATYNWDIGTIERPTAQPRKFEVPSHQWIDLTGMSGKFGATVLTDCKNGSDKPNDHTIRLTLIRTPGVAGGYPDQATQDIGHHEFVYGFAGHAGGWRDAETDWQAERLNDPLLGFTTIKHAGELGKTFSLLHVSNPRIRVLAVKKAEGSDEVIVRMVELDGKPQPDVRVSFAAPITAAREVNGQEQPVGNATLERGALVASFGAYQPRTFALRLSPLPAKSASVQSAPLSLHCDVATASNSKTPAGSGFDGKGNALPAEMLPQQIMFHDVRFELAKPGTGEPNAILAKGQTVDLPEGRYDRVYILAASAEGDQKATFEAGREKTELTIQDWSGFIGQWDDREWSSNNTSNDNYGEMIGLKPGYIKRAELAWYCDHHHDSAGQNVAYRYSYLFGYAIDLPAGAKTLRLPDNNKIRILAISVANENPELKPVQPLYDVLPSPNVAPSDFTLSAESNDITLPQGRSATMQILVLPRGNLSQSPNVTVAGLPAGVTASFSPVGTTGSGTLTLTAASSANPGSSTVAITGMVGSVSHSATATVMVTAILTGTVPVDLSSAYDVTGIYNDGSRFDEATSLDGDGFAFSQEQLGSDQIGDGVRFRLGPANAPDIVAGKTVALPSGKFSSLRILALGVNGSQELQTFTVNYADGTSSSFSQSLSDWAAPQHFPGESLAFSAPYRLVADGSKDTNTFCGYAYSFTLASDKAVRSISLPNNRDVLILAATLVP